VAGAPLHLKTAMTMLNEEAQRHSMDEYSAACGITRDIIEGWRRN
jgi:tetrathionate reductase subunit A